MGLSALDSRKYGLHLVGRLRRMSDSLGCAALIGIVDFNRKFNSTLLFHALCGLAAPANLIIFSRSEEHHIKYLADTRKI